MSGACTFEYAPIGSGEVVDLCAASGRLYDHWFSHKLPCFKHLLSLTAPRLLAIVRIS